METKNCSKCGNNYPKDKIHFATESNRIGKEGYFRECKSCYNIQSRIRENRRAEKIKKEFGSVYAYKKSKNTEFTQWNQNAKERYANYRKNKVDFIVKHNAKRREIFKNQIDAYDETYIIKLIYFSLKKEISKEEILKNKELIELYRLNLKLKRLTRCKKN